MLFTTSSLRIHKNGKIQKYFRPAFKTNKYEKDTFQPQKFKLDLV